VRVWRVDLVVIFDAHAHRVDKNRQQNGALEVPMVDDKFESTSQGPQTQTPTGATYIYREHCSDGQVGLLL